MLKAGRNLDKRSFVIVSVFQTFFFAHTCSVDQIRARTPAGKDYDFLR